MNAIILAAGTSSRFVPLSVETPKGLLVVKGEVLIERQIRQLRDAGVNDITVVTGCFADSFAYLQGKFGVSLVYNEDFNRYNNTSSIIRVVDRLSDTFICCSDHYFKDNVFLDVAVDSFYAAKYANGITGEYCLDYDGRDYITGVTVGGKDAWYMAGHVFFRDSFSRKFREIMISEYEKESVRQGYWEDVYINHLKELPMQIRRFPEEAIFEFDTLDELRLFDTSYVTDTRSHVIKDICKTMRCQEQELHGFSKIKHSENHLLFSFMKGDEHFIFDGGKQSIIPICND